MLMQAYLSDAELEKTKIHCLPELENDIKSVCQTVRTLKSLTVIPKENILQNTVNGRDLLSYVLIKKIYYWKCKISLQEMPTLPKLVDKKYILVEDYIGDQNIGLLEKIAVKHNIQLFSFNSFTKQIKNTIIDKSKYSLIQKIGILQNAFGYIGYDYSLLSHLGFKFKNRLKTCIIATPEQTLSELYFKFHPTKDFAFMYNCLPDYLDYLDKWHEESKN